MPTIRTHEICAEGLTAHVVKKLAVAFGVSEGTVRAWRQPKESDIDPTGTGKCNPLDQAERLIRTVHKYNPGNARQAAQYFEDLVDKLDHEAGQYFLLGSGSRILDELRTTIRETADVATALVGLEFDEHTLRSARREIAEGRTALERLDAVVKAKLNTLEEGQGCISK